MNTKSFLALALTLALVSAARSQALDSLWARTYGGIGDDNCYSMVQTSDGGFAMAGYTTSFGSGDADFWLVRTDENGDSLWSRTYGGESEDVCKSLVQIAGGGFALAGYTRSFGAGSGDFWLVRTDENGDSLWSRRFGGSADDRCESMIQTSDGGFAMAGATYSFGAGSGDFWLVRTDENGDSLWSRTYGGGNIDACHSLIQTADEGFALAGYTQSFGVGGLDFWLVQTNSDGDSLWSRTIGGRNTDVCQSLIQTADEGFALAGYTGFYAHFWLVRTNPQGDSLWSRTFARGNEDECYSLTHTSDGGFAMAGYTYNSEPEVTHFWLVRTNAEGDCVWSRTFDGNECRFLIETTDSGFALAGCSWSLDTGSYDFYLVKTGPENSVPDDEATAPLHFGLDAVYPNPFNSMTTIRCELPERALVKLSAYDVKGRLIDDLFTGTLDAGRHSINWSPASLSSGVYLIRMEAAGVVRMARGVMVR